MTDTAIVIVTFNSASEIGPCIDAAALTGAEIIVVDNASTDGTLDVVRARNVRLIANSRNLGFAAAVNQGFRAAGSELVLLLNPDAVFRQGLDELRDACRQPGVAAAGGRTTDASGRPQAGWMVRRFPSPAAICLEVLVINRLWPRNPVNWRFRCLDLDLRDTKPIEVDQPAGAFFMVRSDAWRRIGGFDEAFYPLWFEDVDFCLRLKEAGLRILHVPLAVVEHAGGHSIRNMTRGFREFYWYGSLLRYASKHFSPAYRRMVCSSVVAGSVIRAIARFVHRGDGQELTVYWNIVGLAARYFVSREPGLKSLS